MSRSIILPPNSAPKPDGSVVGGWWHDEGNRIVCDLCPRACSLKEGDRGFCFVREIRDGEMLLTTYGRSTGFCIDPIEKKPLNHFYPGTSVLSFGTAGCNLGCKFCQNWSISKSREVERLSENATPETIAAAANRLGCRSVAFTYNDPVIWAEYAIEVAKACHDVGVKTVAVTAGYITESARKPFFDVIDAANVDLKAFTEQFYQQLTASHIQPVLDTLAWLRHESDVWFEITNLVIPQANDSDDEFRRMCDWMLDAIGDEVPVHFTAFHPDFKMQDRERTPIETLLRAYHIARKAGIKYVYVGNVNDLAHQSTYCPNCNQTVIERDWYQLGQYRLEGNRCQHCSHEIAGHFEQQPGDWGRKRQPVRISDFAAATPSVTIIENSNLPQHLEIVEMSQTPTAQTAIPTGDVPKPELSAEQQQSALRAVSEVVLASVLNRPPQLSDPDVAGAAQIPVFGCFVSIKRKGKLRGCCGFLGRRASLLASIAESAKTSATGDVRMPSVSFSELPFLNFEIWLLYGLKDMQAKGEDRIQEVVIGKHGLQIQQGNQRGLLLPGVATDNNFDSEGFLRQVSLKAGLPPTAWREASSLVRTFEGYAVNGNFDSTILEGSNTALKLMLTENEMHSLATFCKGNILATAKGAVPTYYLPGCTDGAVHGFSLEVLIDGRPEPLRMSQLTIRQTMPLQSSLFQVCQALGTHLANEGRQQLGPHQIDVNLAVQYDPAMHGSVQESDLDGVDPKYRALMVSQGSKSAWVFDPSKSSDELLKEVSEKAKVTSPDRAMITSVVTQTNGVAMSVVSVPQPQAGPSSRPPAVAGTFYPGNLEELNKMLDDLISTDPAEQKSVPAALVPHAGLRFSGKIAGEVMRRIRFPETVIVIAPKHTALGVEWAVAPHDQWEFAGAVLAADKLLAQELCDAIDGLEMDAAAHHGEHAIEVELPFIHRFAPNAKVVGITIGGGNFEQCKKFAEGLAKVLRPRIDQTLILISSDMNHYASDVETRRVDEIAMQAIEGLDPENILNTVRENDISMCGVLPAVITLQALKQLGKVNQAERVDYDTSATVNNDTNRVVGYAGMLFT